MIDIEQKESLETVTTGESPGVGGEIPGGSLVDPSNPIESFYDLISSSDSDAERKGDAPQNTTPGAQHHITDFDTASEDSNDESMTGGSYVPSKNIEELVRQIESWAPEDELKPKALGGFLLEIDAELTTGLSIEDLIRLQGALTNDEIKQFSSLGSKKEKGRTMIQVGVEDDKVVQKPLIDIISDITKKCDEQLISRALDIIFPELGRINKALDGIDTALDPDHPAKEIQEREEAEKLLESIKRASQRLIALGFLPFLGAVCLAIIVLIEAKVIDVTPLGIDPKKLLFYGAGPLSLFMFITFILLLAGPHIARNSPTLPEYQNMIGVVELTNAYKAMEVEFSITAYGGTNQFREATSYAKQATLYDTERNIQIDRSGFQYVISQAISRHLVWAYKEHDKVVDVEVLKAQLIDSIMREIFTNAIESRRGLPNNVVSTSDINAIILMLQECRGTVVRSVDQIVLNAQNQFCTAEDNLKLKPEILKKLNEERGTLHSLQHNTWRPFIPFIAGAVTTVTAALLAYVALMELAPEDFLAHSELIDPTWALIIFAAIAGFATGACVTMAVQLFNAVQHPPLDTKVLDLDLPSIKEQEAVVDVTMRATAMISSICYQRYPEPRNVLIVTMTGSHQGSFLPVLPPKLVSEFLGENTSENARATSEEAERVLIRILSMVALNEEIVERICRLDQLSSSERSNLARDITRYMTRLGFKGDYRTEMELLLYSILGNTRERFQTMVKAVAFPVQDMMKLNPEIKEEFEREQRMGFDVVNGPVEVPLDGVSGESSVPRDVTKEPITVRLFDALEEHLNYSRERRMSEVKGGGIARAGKGDGKVSPTINKVGSMISLEKMTQVTVESN